MGKLRESASGWESGALFTASKKLRLGFLRRGFVSPSTELDEPEFELWVLLPSEMGDVLALRHPRSSGDVLSTL